MDEAYVQCSGSDHSGRSIAADVLLREDPDEDEEEDDEKEHGGDEEDDDGDEGYSE
jgi:hypothetical protein